MNKHDKPESDIATPSPSFRSCESITVNQLRAGRAIARLSVIELASAAGLSATTISQLETGRTRTPHKATMSALRSALTACGIDFVAGGWTRHIGDATQCSPSALAGRVQVRHDGDDKPEDDDGEQSGQDWQEFKKWLATREW
jgi:transcriptional regulator with XRE-family HTH domain